MKSRNKAFAVILGLWLAAGLFALLGILSGGCSTVRTVKTEAKAPSFDAGIQDGGFVGWKTNSGIVYGVITPHARDRYNALIEKYGAKFAPTLTLFNAGTALDATGNYTIQLESLVNFETMNRWRVEGK